MIYGRLGITEDGIVTEVPGTPPDIQQITPRTFSLTVKTIQNPVFSIFPKDIFIRNVPHSLRMAVRRAAALGHVITAWYSHSVSIPQMPQVSVQFFIHIQFMFFDV